MVSVNDLTVQFGGFSLFNRISFMINPKDRVGLVGKNGAGKSTLLKVLVGEQQADEGTVSTPSGCTLGYLPQHMVYSNTRTVLEETKTAYAELLALRHQVEQLTEQIATRTDYESDSYMKLIDQMTEKSERADMLGANNMDAGIEQTLMGLGFVRSDFERNTGEFSGGWRMRIELAKILLRKPDLLLLDEPTNHLDIESIQWLEDTLREYPGAVVLISHDRAFLDNVTTRTIEISLGRIYDYNTGYSNYVVQRKERREQQMAAYRNQQKMIQETEDFIERFRYKATKAVQVQSRIKQLDKVDRIEVDEEDTASLHIKFPPAPRSGTIVVESEEMSKRYGDLLVLDKIDLIIERGEKVAFAGKNGEGKSTFVKVAMGQVEFTGGLKLGHNVKIGYFAQNQADLLDPQKTVFSTIDDVAVGDIRTKVRDILGAFLFRGEDVDKKVSVLSGGERTRLALAQLLLEPYNLLILDEPTNHLDLRSKDVLKQALKQFDGTLVLVSHDRDFLDGLVDKVYEFKDKKVREHLGGIYAFLQKKKKELAQQVAQPLKAAATASREPDKTEGKLQYEQRKELEKKLRKVQNQVKKCETQISELEEQVSAIEEKLAQGESSPELFSAYEGAKQQLEAEMERWESLVLEVEEATAERG